MYFIANTKPAMLPLGFFPAYKKPGVYCVYSWNSMALIGRHINDELSYVCLLDSTSDKLRLAGITTHERFTGETLKINKKFTR
jgi:hypothetical protein